MQWWSHTYTDVLRAVHAQRKGLTESDVLVRQKEYGKNILPQSRERSVFFLFMSQFFSPLMAILGIAMMVSLFLGEWIDFFVVGIALVLNGLLGFFEEYKAHKTLRALELYLPLTAHVMRDGHIVRVTSEEIVPGDILVLRAGDKIVADARICFVNQLAVNESALTGESMNIIKQIDAMPAHTSLADRRNMVYAGTIVTEGMGEAIVIATNAKTEMGAIALLVQDTKQRKTPLQMQIASLARILTWIVLGIIIFIGIFGLAQGYSISFLLYTGIAIAVSVVPEGLAIATTAILAIGMRRLLKRHVLVRRLVSAETLGSVSVICVDKTGTLTTGNMKIRDVVRMDHTDFSSDIIRAGWASAMMNGLEYVSYASTEKALAQYLATFPSSAFTRESFIPFSSKIKYSASVFVKDDKRYGVVMGAPDILLSFINNTDRESAWAHKTVDMEARQGKRLIALGICVLDDQEIFDKQHVTIIEMAIMEDPVRADAKVALADAEKAGLRTMIITGDHMETARAVARELGLFIDDAYAMTGTELDQLSDIALRQRIHGMRLFARVTPEHKLRIVHALQAEGDIVAMMGDGVNDAPALKSADIGISIESGTEVAKEASDMILLDHSFSRIIDAIFEGRILFDNIRKVILFLLITSVTELLVIIGSMILHIPIPLSPVQLLWINLVTDAIPAFALAFEPGERALWSEGPRMAKTFILNIHWYLLFFIGGTINAILLLALYMRNIQAGIVLSVAQSTLFLSLAGIALFFIFSARVLRMSILHANPFRNPTVFIAIGLGLLCLCVPFFISPMRILFSFPIFAHILWVQVGASIVVGVLILDLLKRYFIQVHHSRV